MSTATISLDQRYRYRLTRDALNGGSLWGCKGTVLWVMLNPSTADASEDDPTIRRCIGFTREWGYCSLVVVNLYALRSTNPRHLWDADDPVGPENDAHIVEAARTADLVVCAWGGNAKPDRVWDVLTLLEDHEPQCLGTTVGGSPRHPLYLRKDTRLRPFAA